MGVADAGSAADVDGLTGDEVAIVPDRKQPGRGDLIEMPLPVDRDARFPR